jgi:toxin YoeB
MTEKKFTERGWDDYVYIATHERTLLKRLNRLIEEAGRSLHEGIGKPEPLAGNLAGWWSRRLTDEHRLVYRMEKGALEIVQCRYHYED